MKEQDQDNLNPHAEAILAVALWGELLRNKYSEMEFWQSLTKTQRDHCIQLAEKVREADRRHGI